MMVGYERREVEEAGYLEYIEEMSDDRLEEEARDMVFLSETVVSIFVIHRRVPGVAARRG